jgi:hypothetical protein
MEAMMKITRAAIAAGLLAVAVGAAGQTPQPFPGASQPQGAKPGQPPQPAPPVSTPSTPTTRVSTAAPMTGAPSETQLGFPIFPAAQFLTDYDAGRGQRYYLFGSTAPFAELVQFYRSALKEKGNLVFEQPATHVFEVGKFREETMAFPPGVTIKDFTSAGTGYPNPKRDAQPERFATVIQIVPAPPAAAPSRK